jgi:hypothetical protein
VFYVGVLATVGIGSIVAPLAIHALGIRGAIAATGALLPAVALVLYRRIERIDERATVPEAELDLIRSVPLFEPLPPTSLEKLARAAVWEPAPAGTDVVREGEHGDTFYVVAEGSLVVKAAGHRLEDLAAGDFFGEIALLRDVERTATVEALTDANLLAVHRLDFLSAILGTLESATTADDIVSRRLDRVAALP